MASPQKRSRSRLHDRCDESQGLEFNQKPILQKDILSTVLHEYQCLNALPCTNENILEFRIEKNETLVDLII